MTRPLLRLAGGDGHKKDVKVVSGNEASPAFKRAMSLEGVPTPIPILEPVQ